MKRLFLLLFSVFTLNLVAESQIPDDPTRYLRYQFQYGMRQNRLWSDSILYVPLGDTALFKPHKDGSIMQHTDGKLYIKFGPAWTSPVADTYWQLSSTLLTPKSNYYVKIQNPSTSNTGFSDWPYSTTFNKSVLGIYGKEPSLDVLIDSTSQFQIGAISFRSNKLATGGILNKFPKLPASRFSANAYAVIEANAFQNGGAWTSTIEFYLGDSTGNNVNVPLAVSAPGNHFFGNRTYFTSEAKEALYFGTAINRVSNFTFGSLNTFFAGNLNNLPAYMLNAPTILADTTNNKVWVRNPSTGAMQAMYWPNLGGSGGAPGGSGTEMQYRVDATTFGGGAGTTWDNTNSGLTINKTSLGVTQNNSAGFIASNTTAAAAGAQQISPAIKWLGNGWKTGATAASQTVEFRADMLPVQGSANPTGTWRLMSSINGAAFANALTVSNSGTLTTSGDIVSSNVIRWGASQQGLLTFSGSSVFIDAAAASGALTFRTNGSATTALILSTGGLSQFGGTTSSFPALKRNSTMLQVRLADDSDFAPLSSGQITINGVQDFADNAAAITGGLTTGQVYRTGDILKIVH